MKRVKQMGAQCGMDRERERSRVRETVLGHQDGCMELETKNLDWIKNCHVRSLVLQLSARLIIKLM